MKRILLTNYYSSEPLAVVRKLVPQGFELLSLERPGKDEVLRLAPQADYILAGGRTVIDADVLDAACNLKMIQRSGVGLDSLNLDEIRIRNIPLFVNEGVNAISVAEHTMMLILSTQRHVTYIDRALRMGRWLKHDVGLQCHNLQGKVLGLVGLGRIGTKVAAYAAAFGMKVCYYKPHRLSQDDELRLGVQWMELPSLLAAADIVSLHCPLTPLTRHIMSYEELRLMKTGATLINTSRGGLVDEGALVAALRTGHLAAAGLDVFESEPTDSDNPLFSLENVVVTSHTAGITQETFTDLISRAFDSIQCFDRGDVDSSEAVRVV